MGGTGKASGRASDWRCCAKLWIEVLHVFLKLFEKARVFTLADLLIFYG
jgi:hypothetical protein